MLGMREKNAGEHYFYDSANLNKHKRSCIILFLFAFCLKCDANFHDLELQKNFDGKRFFIGTWYETHRLNKTLTSWAKCIKIDSSILKGKIYCTTSAYIPLFLGRRSFKSSMKLDGQNKPYFLMNISIMKWNVSIISTDYKNYALAHSRPLKVSSHSVITPPYAEIILVFRRNKKHKGPVKELVRAAKKIGISYNDLSIQRC